MNRDAFQVVLDELKKEREYAHDHAHAHFEMGTWLEFTDDNVAEQEDPPTMCQTAACLAGTAVLKLKPFEEVFERVLVDTFSWKGDTYVHSQRYQWAVKPIDFSVEGQKLLGIDEYTSHHLFYADAWPQDEMLEDMDTIDKAIWILEEMLAGRLTLDDNGWKHPDFVPETVDYTCTVTLTFNATDEDDALVQMRDALYRGDYTIDVE